MPESYNTCRAFWLALCAAAALAPACTTLSLSQAKTSPFIFYAIDADDTSADITSKEFGIVRAIARDKGLVVEPSLAVKPAMGEVREYRSSLIQLYIAEWVGLKRPKLRRNGMRT